MSAISESFDTLRITARGIRPFALFKYFWLFLGYLVATLSQKPPFVTLNSQSTSATLTNAIKEGISGVRLFDHISEDLLQNKHFLRHIKEVWLRADSDTERYMEVLANSCPKLTSLFLSQTKPLSRASIKHLAALQTLKSLEVGCTVEDPAIMPAALPKSLEYLRIEEEYIQGEFKRLQFLSVNYSHIDHEFLDSLQAPNLERLDFSWVDMKPGSLRGLARFERLNDLSIYNANMDKAELKYVSQLDFLTTVIQSMKEDTPYRSDFLRQAEEAFAAEDYQVALSFYRALAFTKPSSYLYSKLGNCYFELGSTAQATRFCILAEKLDPKCGCGAVAVLRSHLESQGPCGLP